MNTPRTVSSSEAQNKFGTMLQWSVNNNDEIVVERRGKPAGVIISYAKYQKLLQLREQERKRRALESLESLRRKVQRQNPDITAEEAYRAAGFSEEVVQETLKSDADMQ